MCQTKQTAPNQKAKELPSPISKTEANYFHQITYLSKLLPLRLNPFHANSICQAKVQRTQFLLPPLFPENRYNTF